MFILKSGKRYYWYTLKIGKNNAGRYKSGLFTGNYDNNGNALLMTRNGETWSIPKHDLRSVNE